MTGECKALSPLTEYNGNKKKIPLKKCEKEKCVVLELELHGHFPKTLNRLEFSKMCTQKNLEKSLVTELN